MSNLTTDNDTLALESDYEEPGRPLVEYARIVLAKIELLWLQKWWLLVPAVIGFSIALGITFIQPARYVATAAFLPPEMNPTSGLDLLIGMKTGGEMVGGGVGNVLTSMLGSRTPGQLYIQEMQSRPIEDSLIDRFDLKNVYRTKFRETTRKALEGSARFDEDRKSGIITVSVTDTDPSRAAMIANGFAEALGQFLAGIDSDNGHREREYFEVQLKLAQERLEASSKALGDFSGKNSALNLPLQDTEIVGSMASVEGRLIAAQTQLNGLLPIYTENNIRVKEARAQIAELQRQLNQMQGETISSAPAAPAMGREGASSKNSSSKMQRLAELSPEYMNLFREAQIDETMVATLRQQYEIASLEESRHISKIRLLDPAQVPERKTFPKRRLMCTVGFVIGFLLGIVYVLLLDLWNHASNDNEWKKLLREAWIRFRWRKSRLPTLPESY